jgi:hypothetical protein
MGGVCTTEEGGQPRVAAEDRDKSKLTYVIRGKRKVEVRAENWDLTTAADVSVS